MDIKLNIIYILNLLKDFQLITNYKILFSIE